MIGPIYFGGLKISCQTETSLYATNKEELQKKLQENWRQEVRNILKFIEDSKLEMPLMKEALNSATAEIIIQEYRDIEAA